MIVQPMRKSCLLVCELLMLGGCGSGLHQVGGLVEFDDGLPAVDLGGGMVVFQPTEGELSAQGEIKSDGTFVLSTNTEADGAAPGHYKVLITEPARQPREGQRLAPLVDRSYSALETTSLEAQVEPKRNEFTFKVRRAKRP